MAEPIADMRLEDGRSSVSLEIPCRADYLSLGRLLVGALGTREGIDEETIADMKMVVTEVCSCFLGAHSSGADCVRMQGLGIPSEPEAFCPGEPWDAVADGSTLKLDLALDDESWTVVISNPGRTRRISAEGLCDPANEGGLGLMIVQALVDSMEMSDDDSEGSVFRLMKVLAAEPGSEE